MSIMVYMLAREFLLIPLTRRHREARTRPDTLACQLIPLLYRVD